MDAAALAGMGGRASQAYGLWCVDVPAASWKFSVEDARDSYGLSYLDWLCGVDEEAGGFSILAHVLNPDTMAHLLLRTRVTREDPRLTSIAAVHHGAAWHERETAEMYGVTFDGHPSPGPLLLPDCFEGHPLRKDFVLVSRVVKAWPGAKGPGENDATVVPRRRTLRPAGVPQPGEWGPEDGGG